MVLLHLYHYDFVLVFVVVQFHAEIEGRAVGVRTLVEVWKNYSTKIQPAKLPFVDEHDHW
ncbi:hypothetical protein BDA99DRAFT_527145 [Phascolomyces articulosus]|uniref:Uncharacterized protein n=1 Tax=Phascolomyces articulosus TaxID=60185 RepID=A0AAD5JNJ5_9FUNG|nr:hypothetical protein BDA99DRAFT_527145 [Phascolomyces articulosus]